MSNSLLITLQIIAVFTLSVSLGYIIGRTSERAGIAFAATGSLSGAVSIVNYFQEVPVIIVAATFAAFGASMIFGLFEVIRKDAIPHPT